ncbi:MAG: PspC domain-containing protein, partial [Candidatus Microsaccharimonas sp.]
IEVAAKKELEKYIKSLEAYTQDADVLTDIEIRITELLVERKVAAGGVITSDDVAAIRKQLGEPYEFADDSGDIAVGPEPTANGRRFYRSTDDAVLGGVLSGIAAYFGVNPMWTRLVFVLLLFISFGFASLVYILFWVITPPARTAAEKLRLAGKVVTLESIKGLNIEEETGRINKVAPVLQRILGVTLGTVSLLGAVMSFIGTAWLAIAAATSNAEFIDMTNGFIGLGDGNAWIAWLVFGIVLFGLLLLTALFSLIAYGFFAKKLTKRMVVSGIVIIVLGITSFAATLAISSTQSFRIADETRSMVRETKTNLPKEFANVKTVTFTTREEIDKDGQHFFTAYPLIKYVVDEGPARYEFTALPSSNAVINTEGTAATIEISVPESFRNSFVQPALIVYGPALDAITSNASQVDYEGGTQNSLMIDSKISASTSVSGTYAQVAVEGSGTIDLAPSAIQALTVQSEKYLTVIAGTVHDLTVTQPEACAASSDYEESTSVQVEGVTSNTMVYNGTQVPAESKQINCGVVVIGVQVDGFRNYR